MMSSALSMGLPQDRHCSNISSVEVVWLCSESGPSSTSSKFRPPSSVCVEVSSAVDLGDQVCEVFAGEIVIDWASPGSSGMESASVGNASDAAVAPPTAVVLGGTRGWPTYPAATCLVIASTMACVSTLLSEPFPLTPPASAAVTHSLRTAKTRARAPRTASSVRLVATSAGNSCRSKATRSGLFEPFGAVLAAMRQATATKRTAARALLK
mmetsp:Transcript_17463/g.34082  ORF Transcript_17463/g.34082 Transcript_17463/m.34082 type:complete len:211 (-) Transcript_17463:201-833(-)